MIIGRFLKIAWMQCCTQMTWFYKWRYIDISFGWWLIPKSRLWIWQYYRSIIYLNLYIRIFLAVKWKSKFHLYLEKWSLGRFWGIFLKDSPLKDLKNVLKSYYRICLSAWQTDDWSSLSKNKFHPSRVKNDEILDGYLSALKLNQVILITVF